MEPAPEIHVSGLILAQWRRLLTPLLGRDADVVVRKFLGSKVREAIERDLVEVSPPSAENPLLSLNELTLDVVNNGVSLPIVFHDARVRLTETVLMSQSVAIYVRKGTSSGRIQYRRIMTDGERRTIVLEALHRYPQILRPDMHWETTGPATDR